MTATRTRPAFSAAEHAYRILIDEEAPAEARRAAARAHAETDEELGPARLDALRAVAVAASDDALWADLMGALARAHPDSRAVWTALLPSLGRLGRLSPRDAAAVLRPLLLGGLPPREIATQLVAALGLPGATPALTRLFPPPESLDDLDEALRGAIVGERGDQERSACHLHLIALCAAEVRRAIGRSAAYTRYRSIAWALQDWPYATADDVMLAVARGVVARSESSFLATFSTRLRSILDAMSDDAWTEEALAESSALDSLGKETLALFGDGLAVETLLGRPGFTDEPRRSPVSARERPEARPVRSMHGSALRDLERDVDVLLRALASGEPISAEEVALLELAVDVGCPSIEASRSSEALAERLGPSAEVDGTAARRLRLSVCGLVTAARPRDEAWLASYAEEHARAAAEGLLGAGDRFERSLERALAGGMPVTRVDAILVRTHGGRWSASALARPWRRIADLVEASHEPSPRPELVAAARTFARSEAVGTLIALGVPALRARLGSIPWLEAYPNGEALLRAWLAEGASVAKLVALGAVSEGETAVIERLYARVAAGLARSAGTGSEAALLGPSSIASAFAEACGQLGLSELTRLDELVTVVHAAPR